MWSQLFGLWCGNIDKLIDFLPIADIVRLRPINKEFETALRQYFTRIRNQYKIPEITYNKHGVPKLSRTIFETCLLRLSGRWLLNVNTEIILQPTSVYIGEERIRIYGKVVWDKEGFYITHGPYPLWTILGATYHPAPYGTRHIKEIIPYKSRKECV